MAPRGGGRPVRARGLTWGRAPAPATDGRSELTWASDLGPTFGLRSPMGNGKPYPYKRALARRSGAGALPQVKPLARASVEHYALLEKTGSQIGSTPIALLAALRWGLGAPQRASRSSMLRSNATVPLGRYAFLVLPIELSRRSRSAPARWARKQAKVLGALGLTFAETANV
jgi:hypothetical protein